MGVSTGVQFVQVRCSTRQLFGGDQRGSIDEIVAYIIINYYFDYQSAVYAVVEEQ